MTTLSPLRLAFVATLMLASGCAAPATTAPAPTAPVGVTALSNDVNLDLGQKEFYLTVTRKGGAVSENGEPRMKALSYAYEVITAREAGSGMATGRRQHSPIRIVKEWGASSPQLMQAYATGEMIPKVTLEFPRGTGEKDGAMTIELTNVTLVGIKQVTGNEAQRATCPDGACIAPRELEEISLVCQKATFTSPDKTTAIDDWSR
jgi:type VI secretion system secreted protein Hcp